MIAILLCLTVALPGEEQPNTLYVRVDLSSPASISNALDIVARRSVAQVLRCFDCDGNAYLKLFDTPQGKISKWGVNLCFTHYDHYGVYVYSGRDPLRLKSLRLRFVWGNPHANAAGRD